MKTAQPDSESYSLSESDVSVKVLPHPKVCRDDMAEAATFRGALTFSVHLGNGTLATSIEDFREDEESAED